MMNPSVLRRILTLTLLGVLVPSAAALAEDETVTRFSISGDLTVSVEEATASMIKIRDRIPALTITSAPAAVRKLGQSYTVNLFFSEPFDPQPGTYPVQFSYQTSPNTLGGSMVTRGARFSTDTEGTAEFLEFGDRVHVRFEFVAFETSSGSDERRRVEVEGEASCPRADIF